MHSQSPFKCCFSTVTIFNFISDIEWHSKLAVTKIVYYYNKLKNIFSSVKYKHIKNAGTKKKSINLFAFSCIVL